MILSRNSALMILQKIKETHSISHKHLRKSWNIPYRVVNRNFCCLQQWRCDENRKQFLCISQTLGTNLHLFGNNKLPLCHLDRCYTICHQHSKKVCKQGQFVTILGCGYLRNNLTFSGTRKIHGSFHHLKNIHPIYKEGGGDMEDELDYLKDSADEMEVFEKDEDYQRLVQEYYNIPGMGQRVLVLQPDIKGKGQSSLTTPDLQLAEACALVETLPKWTVVKKMVVPVHNRHLPHVFNSGRLAQLTEEITHNKQISMVFLSTNKLAPAQISALQDLWNIPIIDRYTVVLQIFKEHAKTKEAKLQVALAEIPMLRHCIPDVHEGKPDKTFGGSHYLGGDTHYQQRWHLLGMREQRIKGLLAKVKKQREFLRKGRQKRQQPTVAVVGYTNCGKTTLIKALTGDRKMEPLNQLFATLDVTAHGGALPNNLSILYMDTVGFIADIPTTLIDAFAATLEDALVADVIIHLQDVSHPDRLAQKDNVQKTLQKILTDSQYRKVINVGNKVDLVKGEKCDPDCINISSVRGHGLHELQMAIQKELLVNKALLEKKISIPASGAHLSWLYNHATVQAVDAAVKPNHLLVDIVISHGLYAKFKAKFGKPVTRKVKT
ncbi:putative GTP-binding protein 6 [Ylistrum balloti]|uniref:putative GTP-binding protein 6 n=1 Tax=Ylistrum balloti TaxID=509963 RepID=UPI002905C84C|nr:putative GTP-binding protein 6 [Ylistrum balloti]